MHRISSRGRFILAAAILAGCGGEAAGPTPTTGLKSIALSAPTSLLTALGQTVQITAQGRDAGGSPVALDTISWTSSNPVVAPVSATGVVTALSNGGVQITARQGSVSSVITITVTQRLTRIDLSAPTTLLSALGDTVSVTGQGFDSAGAPVYTAISWSSSNPAAAVVVAPGRVTAMANGTTTITARVGLVTADIDITVQQQATQVGIGGAPPSMIKAVGAAFDLSATVVDRNNHPVPQAGVAWSTSNAAVVDVTAGGRITTTGVGTATITALSGTAANTLQLQVVTSRRVPIDPYLASPAAGAQWEVSVAIVAYIPTADGVNLDVRKSPDFYSLGPMSLDSVEQRVLDYSRRRKMMIEQGSRFHGYKDPTALPSIGYRVVEHIIVYDITPPGTRTWPGALGSPRFPDFFRLFADLGLDQLIPQQGIREVWLAESSFDAGFPSYDPAIHDTLDARANFESNMSSPTTGDVSNSFRWNDDLPVYGHTYALYGINFRRSQAEAVHNVGHQLEAMLSHVNWLQDGNSDLFWKQFVGQSAGGAFITGRAGWTHMPPNTTANYDYLNSTLVPSDIEDWRPDGAGSKTSVNVNTWGTLVYPWPGNTGFSQQAESQWYTYWMQNHPGRGNQIPHGANWMTNWWAFFADWDGAITSGLGLYGSQPAAARGSGASPARLKGTPPPAPTPHRPRH
jgi:uncharacterized protein YjdB